MKFTLFIILSICAFKSFDAQFIDEVSNDCNCWTDSDISIPSAEITDSFNLENYDDDSSISIPSREIPQFPECDCEEDDEELVYSGRWEMPKFMKDLLEKIKTLLGSIKNGFAPITKSIKDKINQIIASLPSFKNSLMKKVQELIKKGGKVGKECLKKYQGDINTLLEKMKNDLNNCVAQAQPKLKKIEDQVKVLVNKANSVKNGITAKATKCWTDNKTNPTGFVKCLTKQAVFVVKEIAALTQEVQKTISTTKKVSLEISGSLAVCAKKVQDENTDKQIEILGLITKCIKNGGKSIFIE